MCKSNAVAQLRFDMSLSIDIMCQIWLIYNSLSGKNFNQLINITMAKSCFKKNNKNVRIEDNCI